MSAEKGDVRLSLAFLAAFLSTVIGYYFVGLYSDISTSLRHPSNPKPPLMGEPTSVFSENLRPSTRKAKCLRLGHALFFGILYYALQTMASAYLMVSAMVPFTFLFFFYAMMFRMCDPNKSSSENASLVVFSILFLSLSVGCILLAPRDNYDDSTRVIPSGLEVVSAGSYTYWIIIGGCLVLFFVASLKDSTTNAFAKYIGFGTCGMHLTLKDMQTFFKALLAGSIGGQGFAMIRVVAEGLTYIIKRKDSDGLSVLTENRTYVTLALTIILNILHILGLHRGLSDLSVLNVSLFMPVYVLFYSISALICATLYLREFFDVPELRRNVYIIFVGALMFQLVILIYYSLSKRNEPTSRVKADTMKSRKSEEDLEFQSVDEPQDATQNVVCMNGVRNLFADNGRPTLWSMSLARDEEMPGESSLPHLNDTSGRHKPTETSSETVSNPEDDFSHGNNPYFNTDPYKFDYNYPFSDPKDTMVGPVGRFNPHSHSDCDKVGEHGTTNEASTWLDPGGFPGEWRVRGPNYLQDRVKVPSLPSRMSVVNLDWLYFPSSPAPCVSMLKDGFVQKHHAGQNRPFMFIINFMVPSIGNYATYFVPRSGLIDDAFAQQLKEFIEADDDSFRNERFKLIPKVLQGNFIVKKAVGGKPAILGKKLAMKYYRGKNWFEASIDVSSSKIGKTIMGSVKGFATTLVLHMGYLIESKTMEELPEKMLGGVDIYYPVMVPKVDWNLTLREVEEEPENCDKEQEESNPSCENIELAISDRRDISDSFVSCQSNRSVH